LSGGKQRSNCFGKVFPSLLSLYLVAACPSLVRADGGTVRQSLRQGQLQVTIFTSPTPPRAGLVDVSILVLDSSTGEACPEAPVAVQAVRRGQPGWTLTQHASHDVATNKLMTAAILDLPASGTWDVQVSIDYHAEHVHAAFEMVVAEPIPEWVALAGWIAWPALVVGIYAMHQVLVSRKKRHLRSGSAHAARAAEPPPRPE
jgi:hypothetical protein